MPVPTQHQKDCSGVEYVRKCPGFRDVRYVIMPRLGSWEVRMWL